MKKNTFFEKTAAPEPIHLMTEVTSILGSICKEMKTIRDFISQYPTPEGECYELERTSPRYKGIILTDRNNVEN